jgi:chemotaxis protein methyltransferase CheR
VTTTIASPIQQIARSEGPPDPYLVKTRDLIYQVAGIFQPDNKLRFLEDRCQRRLKELRITTLREYYDCLTVKPIRQAELVSLLNEITIGETCFFRNQAQLDALRNVVLPAILEAKSKLPLRHLRIWSAGCSTGEEPYTLNMVLMEESAGQLKNWTFEILATDLNERSLAHCKNGVYGDYSTRNLTPHYRQKYFDSADNQLRVTSRLKSGITFTRLNLLDDARMAFMKSMDVIFCCNVLIYFDVLSKRHVIQHFYNNLLPHGYFFLGHSESLFGITDDFRLVHLPSTTAYIKSQQRQAVRR